VTASIQVRATVSVWCVYRWDDTRKLRVRRWALNFYDAQRIEREEKEKGSAGVTMRVHYVPRSREGLVDWLNNHGGISS
jgi:hypothetical protein